MKSFLNILKESTQTKDEIILNLWSKNWDVDDIIKHIGKSVDKNYIKKLLKKNNKKGWEEI